MSESTDSSSLVSAAFNTYEARKASEVCTSSSAGCVSLMQYRSRRGMIILIVILGTVSFLMYKSYQARYKNKGEDA